MTFCCVCLVEFIIIVYNRRMSSGLPFESTVKIISKLKSSQQERKKLKISTFTKSNRRYVCIDQTV